MQLIRGISSVFSSCNKSDEHYCSRLFNSHTIPEANRKLGEVLSVTKKVNFHREQQRPTHPHWYTTDSIIIRLAWLRYLPQIFFLSCFQNLYFLSSKTERSVYIKTEEFLESFWRSFNQYKLFTSEPLDDWNDSNVSSRKTLNAESAKTGETERVSQFDSTRLEIINCSLGKNRIVSA